VVKKRKRALGGGRKPNPYKKVMFSTRLEPEVMAALKAAAADWPGGNVSAFTEFLINKGLREREENRRDPALRALFFFIAILAERIEGSQYDEDSHFDDESPNRGTWRTDPFAFRAFKVAIAKLLDALEEPPGQVDFTEKELKEIAAQASESLHTHPAYTLLGAPPGYTLAPSDEFNKRFVELHQSPEAWGADAFAELWESAHKTDPFTERERQIMRASPSIRRQWEQMYYGAPQALSDLTLKDDETKLGTKMSTRIQKPKGKRK
jgi:hypothetical protein